MQMKQICLGIDIIEIKRISQAVSLWRDRFKGRIFTGKELELCKGNIESLAVRFAGKEAVFKALSKPGIWLSWQDIEILCKEDGRPYIILYGEAMKRFNELGLESIEISMSHSRENAIAVVIGLAE
jgi:holo-[acyl-carrier protein] synthase